MTPTPEMTAEIQTIAQVVWEKVGPAITPSRAADIARDIYAALEPTASAPDQPSEDGLLPCPWCGGKPTATPRKGVLAASIGCTNKECSVQPEVLSMRFENAIAAWNARAAPPQADAALMVTDEAVKRAARAICETDGFDPDRLEPGDDPYHGEDGYPSPCIDGYNHKGEPCHFKWRQYDRLARAALKAAGMTGVGE